MQAHYTRGKRLSMEETVMVYKWLEEHEDIVEDALPHVERICRRVKADLGIPVTPNAVERLSERKCDLQPTSDADNSLVEHLVEAVEFLFDQLGEEPHQGLAAARRMMSS